jgi:hypothetical protein
VAGFLALAVAYPLSIWVVDRPYIFTYSQNVWCILAIPIMLVFTYGAVWKRATSWAATATFVFVLPFVAFPFIFGNTNDNYLKLPFVAGRVHLFNFACLLWVAAAIFMAVASLLTRPADPGRIKLLVWCPAMNKAAATDRGSYGWYQTVGFWSLVATVIFVAIYLWYW